MNIKRSRPIHGPGGLWFTDFNDSNQLRYRVFYVGYDFLKEEFAHFHFYPGKQKVIDMMNRERSRFGCIVFYLGVVDATQEWDIDIPTVVACDCSTLIMSPSMTCDLEVMSDEEIISSYYDMMGLVRYD